MTRLWSFDKPSRCEIMLAITSTKRLILARAFLCAAGQSLGFSASSWARTASAC